MQVKLECIKPTNVCTTMYEEKVESIKEGEILLAEFSEQGVLLLINKVWTLPFSYKNICDSFKVFNQ